MLVNFHGNNTIWHNLVNDCLTKKIAHAYIFAGIKGIGKAKLAKEFIKHILKADDILSERIDEGSFLDLLYITKQDKNEIGIEQIRNAADFFSYTPAEGTHKFVIIDSADDLNLNAANSLLKILEEPPKNTYLFLISHSPNKLLSTIRSRSRIIKFFPLSTQDLKLITDISTITLMEDFIAGSAEKALLCKEQDAFELYSEIITLIQKDNILEFNRFFETLNKSNEKWQLTIELVQYFLSRLIKFHTNCIDILQMNDIEQNTIPNLSKTKTTENWFELYDEFIHNQKQLEIFNLDKKQLLLILFEKIRR